MKLRPASWLPVTGNQVFTFVTSGSRGWAQHYAQSGASFIRVGNLDHDTIALDLNDVQCVQPPVGAEGERTRLQAHDVLVSITAEVGMVGLVPPGLGEAYINQHIALARPVPGLEPRFLAWYLASEADGKRSLLSSSRGGTKSGLGLDDIRQVEIPLAPLAEQQRIADKLDAVVARVDACRDRLARVTPLLKRFRQSVLAAATSGRLTTDWRDQDSEASPAVSARSPMVIHADEQDALPSGWSWQQLVAIARLESGHTPRKSVSAYWDGGDVPWISLQDIRAADGRVVTDTKFHPTQAGIDNSSARFLPAGTVCFCRDISFGYVTIMGRSMATSQHFANWVCTPQLLPEYLMYSFMAARQFLGMSGQGTTVTTIYMPALKQLRLATPAIDEQAEIVRCVDTLFAFVDRLEARLAKAQAAADRLTPSLLAKAFRGELVPQDPADEPAAVLLHRLAASRQAPSTKTRRPRSVQAG